MQKFATTYSQITVGHAETNLMAPDEVALRHPSLEVWPRGPNRSIRMAQDGPWTPDSYEHKNKKMVGAVALSTRCTMVFPMERDN